jgi:hypothetical protein
VLHRITRALPTALPHFAQGNSDTPETVWLMLNFLALWLCEGSVRPVVTFKLDWLLLGAPAYGHTVHSGIYSDGPTYQSLPSTYIHRADHHIIYLVLLMRPAKVLR